MPPPRASYFAFAATTLAAEIDEQQNPSHYLTHPVDAPVHDSLHKPQVGHSGVVLTIVRSPLRNLLLGIDRLPANRARIRTPASACPCVNPLTRLGNQWC